MKILVQWALPTPEDWQELDSSQWSKLPKGPVPSDILSVTDTTKQWIHGINIQGVLFSGFDHYAIENITGGIVVSCWNDDTVDWVGDFFAVEWMFLEPALDVNINKINTRQTCKFYAENQERRDFNLGIVECEGVFLWSEFKAPPANVTRHGVWVTDILNEDLISAQSNHGWKEWVI
jgi:hypothetical protein